MKGRIPIPAAVKLAMGNPGKRPIVEGPKFAPAPEPPEYLDTYARSVWFGLAPELLALGMLTTASRETFAAYCAACSRHEFYNLAWKMEGLDADVRAKAARYLRDESAAMARLGAEFGLTPATAQRLAGAAQPKDELSEFLAKKEG